MVGTISLAGCQGGGNEPADTNARPDNSTAPSGASSVDTVLAEARTELGEAAQKLNDVEITKGRMLDVQSDDFDGFSVGSITAHTDDVNEDLADLQKRGPAKRTDEITVLSKVSTVLEQTAEQYRDIDKTFGTIAGYEKLFLKSDFRNAMLAARKLSKLLLEVTQHSETITQTLADIENSGRDPNVEEFSRSKWITEQNTILGTIKPMMPMTSGLLDYAKTFVHVGRGGEHKRNGEYRDARSELVTARDAIRTAGEKFQQALEEDLPYKRDMIEYHNCHVDGYAAAFGTLIAAMDAYIKGETNTGDERYRAGKKEMEQTHQQCIS